MGAIRNHDPTVSNNAGRYLVSLSDFAGSRASEGRHLDEIKTERSFPNASKASSISCLVWRAIGVTRRRDVPSGTVGGRIPWAKTSFFNRNRHAAIVRRESPSRSARIWLR